MAKSLIGIDVSLIETNMVGSGKTAYSQVPTNLIKNNEIVSPESMSKYLKDLKKKLGASGKNVGIVLPQNAAFYRTINCPVMSDDQVRLNLPYEFRNFVGNDSVKYSYDYFVDSIENGEDGEPKTLHLVAAAGLKSICTDYARVLKRAGLKLSLALPYEVCLINLMKKTADPEKEYCLIGLDYDYTNIYLFKGASLVSSKTIDLGCHGIDEILAQTCRIDEFLAATYRDANHEDCLAIENLKELYNTISLEVMKTINFYRYEHNDSELANVYFYSIGANNKYLIEDICNHTELTVGNVNDILPANYKNNKDSARCLVSIGLTM